MRPDGSCPDCGLIPQVGLWPYPCGGKVDGHVMFMRMAILGKGRTKDYDPPIPFSPIGRTVDRTWVNSDGSTREMKPDEYTKTNVPGFQT